MIGIDTNTILYFLNKSSSEHIRLLKWFQKTKPRLATTHTNVAEALRLLTHAKVFPKPLKMSEAVSIIDDFINNLEITLLENKVRWWKDLESLLRYYPTLKGNHVFDAQIALCFQEHGIHEIVTWDEDFSKYTFLKIIKI